MRFQNNLVRLQRQGRQRLRRIRGVAILAASPAVGWRERDVGITYCILEMYNLWYSYSRCFFLSSALGARDASGHLVSLNVARPKSVDEALTPAVMLKKSNQGKRPPWSWTNEPSWARPAVLLDALDAIGASNRPKVSNALSIPTRAVPDLEATRHFFAHRNRDTRLRVGQILPAYSISEKLSPSEALAIPASTAGIQRTQALVLDWVDDIDNILSLTV